LLTLILAATYDPGEPASIFDLLPTVVQGNCSNYLKLITANGVYKMQRLGIVISLPRQCGQTSSFKKLSKKEADEQTL